jgi:hypothetical protein
MPSTLIYIILCQSHKPRVDCAFRTLDEAREYLKEIMRWYPESLLW